ncbi:MAG: vitamin K epoxide reductase family protein [Synechococcales cyanobacterium RM1_1_8]|nr:vitamin K epoxide reductase family protein [Synechococcales cyanobacterium RM1_1_8]
MRRRRQTSWIQRWSRYLIGGIATAGAALTGYLTYVKFSNGAAACPIKGCDQVLASDYATVFNQPLALFGCLAYIAMAGFALAPLVIAEDSKAELKQKLEDWTWTLLFWGGAAMTVFSGYLMYLLTTELKAFCIYCVGSAAMSLSLLVLTLLGRHWEDGGKLFFQGIIVAMITLIATLGIYASGGDSGVRAAVYQAQPANNPSAEATTTSGPAEIALAEHLKAIGAKKYSAWWCPHCYEQRQLFGKEAFKLIPTVECSPDGLDAQPQACQAAQVQSYPSWEINGQLYAGTMELRELAQLSSHTGPSDFQYSLQTIPRDMPVIKQ